MKFFVFILAAFLLINLPVAFTQAPQPVDLVDPFIGSSNSRWMMFPGPSMPFGMVKLSPDNQANVWNGGYEYTVESISGFSHIHSWSMGGLSMMPTTGNIRTFPGPSDGPWGHMWTSGYRSRIDKDTEEASVGYYKVDLYDYDIRTELSTTTRCGYLRFTFPEGKESNILFNFNFEYEENDPEILGAYIKKVSEQELEGYIKQRSSFADEYSVHFVVRFDQDMEEFQSWEMLPYEGKPLYGTDWRRDVKFYNSDEKELDGDCGAYVRFSTQEGEVIEAQTAISLVSIEQARLNLETEMDPFGWDFNAVVEHNRNTWDKILSRIEVKGGTEKQRRMFYTNLYRSYVARTIWNDVNGRYVDMCENVQQLEGPAKNIYGSDALWGAHWNLFPLWTLLTPDIANDWVNSLLEFYDKGGWLPQGPEGLEYCEVMVAAHQIKLIVSAYQKGIRNFDIEKAYEAIYKNQAVPGVAHLCGGWAGNKNLDSFMKYGYVANEDGPVSNTLEIAFDDWALAQFAKALGKKKDYKYFMDLSQNYQNIFDPQTKYMRQRHADGSWVEDWDSLTNHGTWYGAGYVEGTAWHYSFFVPHDYPGLIDLVGKDLFTDRLEMGFERGFVDIGNQPNMQAPFIFNYTHKPWLTQKYVRKILTEQFDDTPLKGYPGEEDQGQLGAWYVLASMGLFQMDGGCSEGSAYDITSPVFDEIIIHLDEKYYSGKNFVIRTVNSSPENIYIQDILLNGKPLEGLKIPHEAIVEGGEMVIELGSLPPNPH
jgi:predicted alpha-1,2-mannosidase